MADIHTKMKVECSDGPCGKSTHLIVDPASGKLTHFVVKGKNLADSPDRLVPIEKVVDATRGVIRLNCTIEEVSAMPPFTTIHIIHKGVPDYADAYEVGSHIVDLRPPVEAYSWNIKAELEQVPAGEVALSQDMVVQTSEGKAGQVDGLVVDPESGQVTHLLMRKGHLWGAKDVTIPISAIEKGDEGIIYLKIDKEAIKQLPSVKLKPHIR